MNKRAHLSTLLITSFLITAQLSALSEEPNQPKPASASVYNLGLKSYEQGDTESAITFFKQAIDLDPGFVDAYYNLGAIYKKQGNNQSAIGAFRKAVEINPSDYEARFELAICLLEGKNYSEAKKYLTAIPSDFPRYDEVKENMEKVNAYLAIESPSTPKGQAQLLANTLTKSAPEHITDTLTKPTKETFDRFKIITSNFNGPAGITKDSKNNIYIANFVKNNIEKINTDGSREIFIENLGVEGPIGLAIDEADNLYVANYNGNSITKISPNKEISVLVSEIIKPYYLFYDSHQSKLYATVQGNDSLIEVNTQNISKQPITSN